MRGRFRKLLAEIPSRRGQERCPSGCGECAVSDHWENGKIREIKTRGEFVKSFNGYFTPEIRKSIATRKAERLPSGSYIITWKARGNEYSLYFKPEGTGFVLDGLSEGPA